MTDIESKVVAAWRQAAVDLGFQFSSPFTIVTHDGVRLECIGLVHQFGRRLGTIISVIEEPSSGVQITENEEYFESQLSLEYGDYQHQLFIDTLDDWQFYGPESERPAWYTGMYWGQERDA